MATDGEEPIPTEPGMYTSLAATRVHSPPSSSVESQPCFPTHMSKCLRQPDGHSRAILAYLALCDPCLLGTLTPSSQGPTLSPVHWRVHALNRRLNTGHLPLGVPTQRGKAIPRKPQDWERGYPQCYWPCGQPPNCIWKTLKKLVYLVSNMQTA